jgi:hypothetical protein
VLVLVLLTAGCGVRNSKPATAAGTAPCLKKNGFTNVTTAAGQVGFIASTADNGGLKATSRSGNVVTIAFAADSDGATSLEEAFRRHASPFYRRHMNDIMQSRGTAVLVWATAPDVEELNLAAFCLHS